MKKILILRRRSNRVLQDAVKLRRLSINQGIPRAKARGALNGLIEKEKLIVFVKNLKSSCDEFIAPKREHLQDVIFGDTKNDGAELLDYEGSSVISPRAFLLGQSEPLFEIKSAKNCQLRPLADKKKRIFYGVRPCDIKALVLMRKFFIEQPPMDIPYKQKMDNAFFISLACGKRCFAKSFCHLMDAGPIAKEGFDLQLIPVRRGYLVEVGSRKGSQIVERNKKLFSKILPQDEEEVKGMLKNFAQRVKKIDPSISRRANGERSRTINYNKLARIMKEDKIAREVWDDIGQRCVACSGCITLCPSCSCFSINDRINGDKGTRFRYCDGCVYAGFTRMAGGNSPFPLHKDHIRRFFEHKLNIDVQRYGTPSCVGCGRCIETCPGNISIKRFIEKAGESL